MTSSITNLTNFKDQLALANGKRRVGIITFDQAEKAAGLLLETTHETLVLMSNRITTVHSSPPVSTAVIMMRSKSNLAAYAFTHPRFRPWDKPNLGMFSTGAKILNHFPDPYGRCFSEMQRILLDAEESMLIPMGVTVDLV